MKGVRQSSLRRNEKTCGLAQGSSKAPNTNFDILCFMNYLPVHINAVFKMFIRCSPEMIWSWHGGNVFRNQQIFLPDNFEDFTILSAPGFQNSPVRLNTSWYPHFLYSDSFQNKIHPSPFFLPLKGSENWQCPKKYTSNEFLNMHHRLLTWDLFPWPPPLPAVPRNLAPHAPAQKRSFLIG